MDDDKIIKKQERLKEREKLYTDRKAELIAILKELGLKLKVDDIDMGCKLCSKYIKLGEKSGIGVTQITDHIIGTRFLEKKTKYLHDYLLELVKKLNTTNSFLKGKNWEKMYTTFMYNNLYYYGDCYYSIFLSGVTKDDAKILINEIERMNKLVITDEVKFDISEKIKKNIITAYNKRRKGKAIDIPLCLIKYLK